jgi:chorismate synthase
MLALVLMDHALRHRAQNADVACPTPKIPAHAPADAFIPVSGNGKANLAENPEPDEA